MNGISRVLRRNAPRPVYLPRGRKVRFRLYFGIVSVLSGLILMLAGWIKNFI